MLTSSASSLPVSQLLTGVAASLEEGVNAQAAAAAEAAGAPVAPPHIEVAATDVVPLADSDPRGTGLTAALFPLVLGGMLGGIAISLAIIGAMRRVTAVLVYSAVGGLLLAGILQGWFGALQGDYWLNAAGIALALAAIAAPITGFVAVMGRAGIALGPIIMLLIANPISAAAIPKEFILAPWGEVGQWFPPGAAATLMRELSYFPAADTTFPWLVLTAWAVGGILLSMIGHFRTAGGAEPDDEAARHRRRVARRRTARRQRASRHRLSGTRQRPGASRRAARRIIDRTTAGCTRATGAKYSRPRHPCSRTTVTSRTSRRSASTPMPAAKSRCRSDASTSASSPTTRRTAKAVSGSPGRTPMSGTSSCRSPKRTRTQIGVESTEKIVRVHSDGSVVAPGGSATAITSTWSGRGMASSARLRNAGASSAGMLRP